MSQVLNVSLDYAMINALAHDAHSAFSRSKKTKKPYLSLSIWVNDDVDEFGNDVKVTMNSTKEKKNEEGIVYVGNGRTPNARKVKKNEAGEVIDSYADDLPF